MTLLIPCGAVIIITATARVHLMNTSDTHSMVPWRVKDSVDIDTSVRVGV